MLAGLLLWIVTRGRPTVCRSCCRLCKPVAGEPRAGGRPDVLISFVRTRNQLTGLRRESAAVRLRVVVDWFLHRNLVLLLALVHSGRWPALRGG